MTEFGGQQIGKILVIAGVFLVVIGVLVMVLGRFGLFRLPGDIEIGGKNWRVYFPLVSSIILSIILTLIFWIIHFFRK